MQRRLLLLAGLALWISSTAATADDKDLLKATGKAPPNVLIVFGNSQTTEQPVQGVASAWDGDADSPASKLGAAKAVLKQFILDKHSTFNIGLTGFSHGADAGSVRLDGKHWLYSPLTEDFPNQPWKEPAGTIERWGLHGEGPCTSVAVPACADRSPSITLPSGVAGAVGPFFGPPNPSTGATAEAYIYLDGTVDNKGNPKNATKRIAVTLIAGKYGDAYTDGTLSALTLGTHSMKVRKVYQEKSGSSWVTGTSLPGDDSVDVEVEYVPSSTLTPELFYTTKPGDINTLCVAGDPDCGKEIGFLNTNPRVQDVTTGASCGGWEFQSNNAPLPLIKIPRDYIWGPNCAYPPQDSLHCINRLMRPQARLVSYDQSTGLFTPKDYDNPGYTTTDTDVPGNYADGCDWDLIAPEQHLLGAVEAALNVVGRQAILETTPNGSQAPIKNLLQDVCKYFGCDGRIGPDGFLNGRRTDDPNKVCRTTGVILIYDTFNACQNDDCRILTGQVVSKFKKMGVPIYVIGFGKGVGPCEGESCSGYCIAQNSGAVFQGKVGYFPVDKAEGLYSALNDIASLLNTSPQTFATAAVSTTQAFGDQMAYFASFSPASERSIWDGRLNGYKLNSNGGLQLGQFTIPDPNDPNYGAVIPVPSNDPSSLIWNAGKNLRDTPGTGATDSNAILKPTVSTISHSTYTDDSNDTVTTITTNFYPGRKIVFSLPKTVPDPLTTLPIPAAAAVPEDRHDMTFTTGETWWPTLRALLGPQTAPPAVRDPPLDDTDATSPEPDPANSDAAKTLRFIWGDRDAVTGATDISKQYLGLKLGDIVHSGPLLVGNPNDFALFKTNAAGASDPTKGYQAFSNTYKSRRRVLYFGANDGLLHALDAGVLDRDTNQPGAYDLGTGVELFAYAPRAIMQIYKPLKDAVGPQTKQNEWTVDLSPSAADVFIDASHSGTPVPANRAWRTVLAGGMREGSPFEGTDGASPKNSYGSYFALDITQPDEITGGAISKGTFAVPKCLDKAGDPSCARDWPTVLWEITDTTDADSNGLPDMGETWSKAAMGRVKVCTANCGTASAVNEDRYAAIFGGGFDRERLNATCAPACNRRGNWLYMVDIETGFALYKVNSGIANFGSGNVSVSFGSIPSGPAALDYDGDGYLDVIYVGDLKGQLWRVDLTELRMLSSPPSGRFANKLDLVSGTGQPFLFFQAPQPTSPATTPFYAIYHRPEAINLGYNAGGRPALGIAFGTGDRDDILATVDPPSLSYAQRFYYVVDAASSITKTESNLYNIASPTAATADTTSALLPNGWALQLLNGERVVGDSLTVGGIIRFPAFTPPAPELAGTVPPCDNIDKCGALAAGVSRLYQVFYTTGNPYPVGATDRGLTQENATFITGMTGYIAGDGGAAGIFWSGGVQNPPLGVSRKITVRSWKEKLSPP